MKIHKVPGVVFRAAQILREAKSTGADGVALGRGDAMYVCQLAEAGNVDCYTEVHNIARVVAFAESEIEAGWYRS